MIDKNISIWRGLNAPPTKYHLWLKGNKIFYYKEDTWEELIEDTALEQPITAMNTSAGNITSGTTIPAGTTFTQFVTKLLVKPNKPIYSISTSLLDRVETGTPILNATGTYVLNQGGQITEVNVTLTGFIDKTTPITSISGNTVTISFTGRIAEGNNKISSTVQYDKSTLFPEITAGSVSADKTIVGLRKIFRGNGIATLTNSSIRQGSGILYTSSFSYNLNAGSADMWIAIPSTRRITKVTDSGALNAVITDNFNNIGIVLIDGATVGKDATSYTVYQLSGYGPFSSAHAMNFTLN